MVGLIAIQFYWISNAVNLRRQHFDQDVHEALDKAVYNLDKQQAAARLKRRMNFRKQGIRHRLRSDSMLRSMTNGASSPTQIDLMEEYVSDSNGVIHKQSRTQSFSGDSTGLPFSPEIGITHSHPDGVPADTAAQSNNWVERQTDMASDIFDELVSINIYNDYRKHIDTLLLDSLVHAELKNKGIDTRYEFAILSKKYDQQRPKDPVKQTLHDSLSGSRFQVNLTPDNVFIEPQHLSVFFPNERSYILQTMTGLLSLSGLFILIIIVSFYFSISFIYRQKKLSDVKNDFISNMTHELKTPISTISLAAEVLGDDSVEKTKERQQKYVRMIQEENKRLGVLVESVLQTAILDKGKFNLKPVPVDLHALIEHVVNNLRLQVEKKSGELHMQLSATNYVIECDKTHVQNIIVNLLDNAIKYTPEKPVIRITTKNVRSGIEISVSDNGIGISRENQKKVFEKLYRVPTGNVHNVKGFGLGLSYVKAIAEKHGGYVGLESEPGKGSRFFVYLPSQIPA